MLQVACSAPVLTLTSSESPICIQTRLGSVAELAVIAISSTPATPGVPRMHIDVLPKYTIS